MTLIGIWNLNHLPLVPHICVRERGVNVGSDNGLSLGPRHYLNQFWNIVNWSIRDKFSEILIEIRLFSFKKMHFKMAEMN